jgi:hypothetical protein
MRSIVNKIFAHRSILGWLVLVWAVVQLFLFVRLGVVTAGESEKYIGEAQRIVSGKGFSYPTYWLYSVQIAVIAFFLKINISLEGVVLVQLLVNLISTVAFYLFLQSYFGRRTAVTGTLFLVINIWFQQFNLMLQTESIFYSISVILACYTLTRSRINIQTVSIIVLLLALLMLSRPNGLLFAVPVFLFLFFRFFQTMSVRRKIFITAACFIAFLFILNLALGSGGHLDFMLPFRDERIICDVPTLPAFLPIDILENGNSIYGLLYYMAHNFEQFSSLAGRRTIAFFGLYRPYFSSTHNVLLLLTFVPLYIMTILSVKWWWTRHRNSLLFFVSLIMMFWLTVMITCDDWHNRFFLTLTPWLIALSMPTIHKLFSIFVGDERSRHPSEITT